MSPGVPQNQDRQMPVQRPPLPIFFASLFAFILACQAQSQTQSEPNPNQIAAKNFRTYLNYQIAKVDAKSHPKVDSRPTHLARIRDLQEAIEKINIKSVRATLKTNSKERSQTLRLLRGYLESIPRQILTTETRRGQLTKMHEDETIEEDRRPGQEVLDRIDAKITWLRQREAMFTKELAAITRKRTAADSALDNYIDLITLGDAKLSLDNLLDPKAKSYAESTIKLLSPRVHGKTLASTRTKLELEQVRLAIRDIAKRAAPIPKNLSPAKTAPDRRKYLTELQQFYKTEHEALQLRRRELSQPTQKSGK